MSLTQSLILFLLLFYLSLSHLFYYISPSSPSAHTLLSLFCLFLLKCCFITPFIFVVAAGAYWQNRQCDFFSVKVGIKRQFT